MSGRIASRWWNLMRSAMGVVGTLVALVVGVLLWFSPELAADVDSLSVDRRLSPLPMLLLLLGTAVRAIWAEARHWERLYIKSADRHPTNLQRHRDALVSATTQFARASTEEALAQFRVEQLERAGRDTSAEMWAARDALKQRQDDAVIKLETLRDLMEQASGDPAMRARFTGYWQGVRSAGAWVDETAVQRTKVIETIQRQTDDLLDWINANSA